MYQFPLKNIYINYKTQDNGRYDMRIELTFKKNEKELYEFVNDKGKYITKSGYIKQLIAKELEKEQEDKK